MTWEELNEKIDSFKNIKIENIVNEEQIKGYKSCGITPEIMYRKCVEIYLKEYLYIKFGLNKTYLINESPVESIALSDLYLNIDDTVERIFEYYNYDLNKVIEYLNSKEI